MIYVNSISHAVYSSIASDQTIVNSGISVDLNEPFNSDPNRTPWVGIYYGATEITPRRVQSPQPWMANVSFHVFVQAHSFRDSATANDLLQSTVTAVMTAVNCDRNFSNTVLTTKSYSILPYERSIENEQWLFTDEIIIMTEVFA